MTCSSNLLFAAGEVKAPFLDIEPILAERFPDVLRRLFQLQGQASTVLMKPERWDEGQYSSIWKLGKKKKKC